MLQRPGVRAQSAHGHSRYLAGEDAAEPGIHQVKLQRDEALALELLDPVRPVAGQLDELFENVVLGPSPRSHWRRCGPSLQFEAARQYRWSSMSEGIHSGPRRRARAGEGGVRPEATGQERRGLVDQRQCILLQPAPLSAQQVHAHSSRHRYSPSGIEQTSDWARPGEKAACPGQYLSPSDGTGPEVVKVSQTAPHQVHCYPR